MSHPRRRRGIARRLALAAALAAGVGLAPRAAAQPQILWDAHHGFYSSFYTLPAAFTKFATLLSGLGYTITQNQIGVLNQDLTQYDVIIVSALSAAQSAYAPAEVAAIQSFVQAGGGLLLMGETSQLPKAGLNSVGAAFDMTFNTGKVFPADTYVTNLAPVEMFQGIHAVYMRYGGEVLVGPGATAVGKTAINQQMIASWNGGRVVGLGDSNLFDDAYLQMADNPAYVGLLFGYLAGGCQTELGPGLAGAGGFVPKLDFGGGTCSGALNLVLQDALGSAPALLLAGTKAAAIPSVGGTVWVDVTTPPAIIVPLPLGGAPGQPGAGFTLLSQNLAAYLPLTLTMQFAVFDGSAPYGVALSNGVKIDMAP